MTEAHLFNIIRNLIGVSEHSICRLCLKSTEQEYVFFEDCMDIGDIFPSLSIVLSTLGIDIEGDALPGIDGVCKECVDKALVSIRFIEQCRNSSHLLMKVFSNLIDAVDVDIQPTNSLQKLYIHLNENECKLYMLTDIKDKKKKNFTKNDIVCSQCDEVDFLQYSDLRNHCATRHSLLPCEKCFKVFINEEELSQHLKITHNYKCNECSQYCNSKEAGKIHYDKLNGLYVCNKCNQRIKDSGKIYLTESSNSIYTCPTCGKQYRTKDFYLHHKELCSKGKLDPHPTRSDLVRPYSCNKCGKRYSRFGSLRVHMRFDHGNAKHHVCNHCGKKFTAPSYLRTHMIKHTGEKNFSCDLCSNKFVSKEALLYHTRRHTGERPYSCKLCDERFVNASERAEHMKYKHIGPTHECDICNRKFVAKSFLKKHMEKHSDHRSKLYLGIGVAAKIESQLLDKFTI